MMKMATYIVPKKTKKPTTKLLFVATINGESSLTSKKAKTYIHSKDYIRAVKGLFKRYMKRSGKANITDLHQVDKETKKLIRVNFNLQECLQKQFVKKLRMIK